MSIKNEKILLNQIPFSLEMDHYLAQLKLGERKRYIDKAVALAEEAMAIAKPKAVLRSVYIEKNDGETVIINGTVFKSRLLSTNFKDLFRVFPFVATCGLELEEWSKTKDNMLEQFWADVLKGEALKSAFKALETYLNKNFGLEKLGQMNPGSLESWPITEQIPLFKLLGETEKDVGVRLTESLSMHPIKSVSGFFFLSETEFKNCKLCPRVNCIGRRTPFTGSI